MSATIRFDEAKPAPDFNPAREYAPESHSARVNIQRLLFEHVELSRQREVLEHLMEAKDFWTMDLPLEAFIPLDPKLDLESVADGLVTNVLKPSAAAIFTKNVEERSRNVASWLLGRTPRMELVDGLVDLQRLVVVEDAALLTEDFDDDFLRPVIELGKDFGLPPHADPDNADYVAVQEVAMMVGWWSMPNSTVKVFGLMHEPVTDRWVWLNCSTVDIISLEILQVVDGEVGRDPEYRRRVALANADVAFHISACDRCGWYAGEPSSFGTIGGDMFTEAEFVEGVASGDLELPGVESLGYVQMQVEEACDLLEAEECDFASREDLLRLAVLNWISSEYPNISLEDVPAIRLDKTPKS